MGSRILSVSLCVLGIIGLVSSQMDDALKKCFSDPRVIQGCNEFVMDDPAMDLSNMLGGSMDLLHVNNVLNALFADMNHCIQRNARKYCSKKAQMMARNMDPNFVKDALLM
ncbi:uncharacterized protein [Parasteatoda tepidariorum]|uniref:uncharacterized protein n=1 Tax=Parasteatoda tepidariorum TaxID=114398 RepID=UPI00077FE4BB|nr:uncharacterized protein LOC107448474 [Parasteatoda tepidariorum]